MDKVEELLQNPKEYPKEYPFGLCSDRWEELVERMRISLELKELNDSISGPCST